MCGEKCIYLGITQQFAMNIFLFPFARETKRQSIDGHVAQYIRLFSMLAEWTDGRARGEWTNISNFAEVNEQPLPCVLDQIDEVKVQRNASRAPLCDWFYGKSTNSKGSPSKSNQPINKFLLSWNENARWGQRTRSRYFTKCKHINNEWKLDLDTDSH